MDKMDGWKEFVDIWDRRKDGNTNFEIYFPESI